MKQRRNSNAELMAKANIVTDECCHRIDDLLYHIGCGNLAKNSRMYVGACPVHGGDNMTAFNLYPEGYSVRGMWACRTHGCHNRWGKTLPHLVRAMISTPHRRATFIQALNHMAEFLGYNNIDEVSFDIEAHRQHIHRAIIQSMGQNAQFSKPTTWERSWYRRQVEIPPIYYLNRNYGKKVLDKYDVGYDNRRDRVVIPIYDRQHVSIVGFTSRSPYNQVCPKCSLHHPPALPCPRGMDSLRFHKWKHTGFEASNFLYNYWYAARHIKEKGVIILVEGPGDVWRLEEAGIHNSVALFGTTLGSGQRLLINASCANKVVLLLDGDKAGQGGMEELKQQLGRIYRIHTLPMGNRDPGDMSVEELKQFLEGPLASIEKEW